MRNLELLYALAAQVMTVTKINPMALQLNEEKLDGSKVSHTGVSIMHAARARIDEIDKATATLHAATETWNRYKAAPDWEGRGKAAEKLADAALAVLQLFEPGLNAHDLTD